MNAGDMRVALVTGANRGLGLETARQLLRRGLRVGGPAAPRSVEEGVETTVWLATLPDDGPSGNFFRDRRSIGW